MTMKHYGPRYRRAKERFKAAFQATEATRQELYAAWGDLKADLRGCVTAAEVAAAIDRAEKRAGHLLED